MRTLRHNKNRLAFLLLLAMVFSIVGVPALAAGCGEMPLGSGAVIGASGAGDMAADCPMMSQPAPCCCHSKVEGEPASHCAVAAPPSGCGCTLDAPGGPPAQRDQVAVRFAAPAPAILPRASAAVALPARTLRVFAAPSLGPPRPAFLASVPSRAPPAC